MRQFREHRSRFRQIAGTRTLLGAVPERLRLFRLLELARSVRHFVQTSRYDGHGCYQCFRRDHEIAAAVDRDVGCFHRPDGCVPARHYSRLGSSTHHLESSLLDWSDHPGWTVVDFRLHYGAHVVDGGGEDDDRSRRVRLWMLPLRHCGWMGHRVHRLRRRNRRQYLRSVKETKPVQPQVQVQVPLEPVSELQLLRERLWGLVRDVVLVEHEGREFLQQARIRRAHWYGRKNLSEELARLQRFLRRSPGHRSQMPGLLAQSAPVQHLEHLFFAVCEEKRIVED